jgi:lipoprotein-anchoring transpeptidase ErfK/SrfK
VITALAIVRPAQPAPHTVALSNPPAATARHTSSTPAAADAHAGNAKLVQLWTESDASPCTANSVPKLVLVSISQQRIWMCERARQVNTTLVTTGAANVGDGTPLGSWIVQAKQTNRYLVGPGYRDFVKYWMPFDGDFGFHDASWQTMPYGSSGYHANGSHGCVHVPLATMTWLFNWATLNTTVTIES